MQRPNSPEMSILLEKEIGNRNVISVQGQTEMLINVVEISKKN